MDDKLEKGRQIVKSIRMLEGVLRTTPNTDQRIRVKKEIDKQRNTLNEMFPGEDISELEKALSSEAPNSTADANSMDLSNLETLKDISIETISTYKDDQEINEAASIMKYFEDRICGVISDQHTKLDFSNSGERDTLYRKLDQCNRSFKIFCQTIEDIDKTKSSEYTNQLQMMRVKQGRVFLYDLSEFLKGAKNFVSTLISDAEFGGTMIINRDEIVEYADYETYKTFANNTVFEALKYMKKFLNEALQVIKVPDIKKI